MTTYSVTGMEEHLVLKGNLGSTVAITTATTASTFILVCPAAATHTLVFQLSLKKISLPMKALYPIPH